jgi:uncharacterized membrane protein
MGRMFWLCMALLIGVAVHIGYILTVPGMIFQQSTASASGDAKINTMQILSKAARLDLLPGYAGESVAAICRFDLAKGKVSLKLNVPPSYWTFAVFTERGRQIYALNDKQAGAETFDVEITRGKSIVGQLVSVGQPEDVVEEITNAAWSVEMIEKNGLALLWVPVSNPLMRPSIEAVVKESKCSSVGT